MSLSTDSDTLDLITKFDQAMADVKVDTPLVISDHALASSLCTSSVNYSSAHTRKLEVT